MKKTSVALIISSALSSPVTLATDNTETIVVTANRTTQDKFDTLASVEVFDRQSIDQLKPDSIAELLSRVAGISATTQGSAGHQTSLFVRGTNSDHVLVLVNGVRVGSATLGSKEFATIPVALVERVEIVKGPRAALWGSDAIGGVIQIFTRQLDAGQAQLGASFGHDSFWQVYGAVGLGNENHSYTISAFAEETDGYDVVKPDPNNIYAADQPDDDGYDRQSLSLVGLSTFNDVFSLEVNAQLDKGNTEIDTSFGGDEFEHDNYHALVRGHWSLEKTNLQLSYAKSVDENEDNGDEQYEGATSSHFKTTRDQVTALGQYQQSANAFFTLGADWYDEEISSHTLYSDTSRDAYAIFATARQEKDAWKFEQAIRYDNVGDTDSETTFQLSAGYQVSEHWLIALSHGTAFKAPSFNDLYWPDAFGSAGNPDLVSETSRNTEILSRFQHNNIELEISAYRTDINDLIEWAPIDDSDPFSNWQPTNLSKAEIKGIDATGTLSFEHFSHQISASHVDAENKQTNSQLFLRPYFSANYSLGYQLDSLDFTVNINYQGGRTDSSGVQLNSATLINVNANYDITDALTIYAKITNLADRDYQLAYQYPSDGQGYRIGLDYRF
jgi:vitamin B12 transporter